MKNIPALWSQLSDLETIDDALNAIRDAVESIASALRDGDDGAPESVRALIEQFLGSAESSIDAMDEAIDELIEKAGRA